MDTAWRPRLPAGNIPDGQSARARARSPGPCSRNPAVIASQTHSIERNVRLLALQLEDGRKTVVAAGAMIPVMRTKHVLVNVVYQLCSRLSLSVSLSLCISVSLSVVCLSSGMSLCLSV